MYFRLFQRNDPDVKCILFVQGGPGLWCRMQPVQVRSVLFLFLVAIAGCVATREDAAAELHWQSAKKEHLKVRLVALAIAYPRSSYFSSQEVFVAEQELAQDETRLVKLVYNFLPYQPRLSEYALDYSVQHEVLASRDPNCDEALSQVGFQGHPDFKYSIDSPGLDLKLRRNLRCYQTSAEDYDRPLH